MIWMRRAYECVRLPARLLAALAFCLALATGALAGDAEPATEDAAPVEADVEQATEPATAEIEQVEGEAAHAEQPVEDDAPPMDEMLASYAAKFKAGQAKLNLVGAADQNAVSERARQANIFSDAIAYAQKRCVRIYGAGIAREHGYATGMIVSDDGLILTAFGLYVTGPSVRVMMYDGTVHEATVERRSERIRSVLLRIKAKTPDYFILPTYEAAQAGDWVLAVANPFKIADRQEKLSVNLGVVSVRTAIDTKKRAQEMDIDSDILIVDAITSNPGSPGGVLVTAEGQVAGMVGKVIQSESTNTWLNYAIPADVLQQFVDGTLEEEPEESAAPLVKGWIGLRIFRLAGSRAGAYVDRVRRGSPAAEAGLRRDDLIIAIGTTTVRNIRDYDELAERFAVGESIQVVYSRRGKIHAAEITPIEEPSDEDDD